MEPERSTRTVADPFAGIPPAADAVRFQLLGGFRIWACGAEVPTSALRRRKLRSLLKLLALAPDHQAHKDRVIEILWPDLAPGNAANQLYNTLSQARKALTQPSGDQAHLTLHDGLVSLRAPGGIETDVRTFTALANAARERPTVQGLERAVASYPGLLLPGDLYEDWAHDQRNALHERYLELLCGLGDALREEGRHRDAIAAFEEALQEDPAMELAHQGLIRLYGETGDTVRAQRQFEACVRALEEGLDVAPSPKTQRLVRQIVGGMPPQGPAGLPRRSAAFVGRSFELSQIADKLSTPDCRLLTLTGLGGIGKTSLAIEALRRHHAAFSHGSVFVFLGQASTREQMVGAMTEALELPAADDDPEHRLIRFLKDRHMLLLLDNADHAAAAAGVLGDVLDRCPEIRMLVTSRQRLFLRSEWILEVGGLEVPRANARADPARFSAVQLFLQGAHRVDPALGSSPEQLAAVQRICRVLRGVPLAIDIASSWIGTLSCEEIAAELERDIDLGPAALRDVPERHQSLRNAFESSWKLLPESERTALARVSVFQGEFSLEAAKTATGTPLGALARLAGRSLVGRGASDGFEVHPVLRQFALEKLGAGPEEQRIREAHAAYYLGRLERWERESRAAASSVALAAIAAEMENIRAAWTWATRTGHRDLLDRGAHGWFAYLELRGWFEEGAKGFERAVQAIAGHGADASAQQVIARLRGRQAACLYRLGRAEEARRLLADGVTLLEGAEDRAELAFLLDRLGVIVHEGGDDAEAERLLQRSLALREGLGDLHGTATSLNNLGSLAYATADHRAAERYFRESLAIQQRLGSRKAAAISLQNLASLAFARGSDGYGEAAALLEEALALASSAGDPLLVCLLLSNLGVVLAADGREAQARRCFGQALSGARSAGATALELRTVLHLARASWKSGDIVRAYELGTYVLQDPASPHDLVAGAARHVASLTPHLSPGQVRDAQRRASAMQIDDVVSELLRTQE